MLSCGKIMSKNPQGISNCCKLSDNINGFNSSIVVFYSSVGCGSKSLLIYHMKYEGKTQL